MKKIIIKFIIFYQRWISPYKKYFYNVFGIKNPGCRYYPTCSQYAVEAISKYGVIKGGFMAIWRILRCNPFSKGGYDPVK